MYIQVIILHIPKIKFNKITKYQSYYGLILKYSEQITILSL